MTFFAEYHKTLGKENFKSNFETLTNSNKKVLNYKVV